MAITRKQFVRAILLTTAVAGGAAWWVFSRVAPLRWVEAARGRIYPGPVRPLDRSAIQRIAPWAG